jgi:hypothetical protein
MTAIQQLILQCFVIEPEDTRAFAKSQSAEKTRRLREKNPEKFREAARRGYWKNPKAARERSRRWAKENPEQVRERKRRAGPDKNLERVREHRLRWTKKNPHYRKNRLASDSAYHLLECLRGRTRSAIRRGCKSAHTLELLGCTIPELRAHLEAQFRPGMTWENYGPVWHVDHIRPCASFDLLDPAQQRACFHYTNLQPLFALENLKKGAR